jgi:hypothetical protein
MIKEFLFYDAMAHFQAQMDGQNVAASHNDGIARLEAILKKKVTDYTPFKEDFLAAALNEIKKTYPKPFALGLDQEQTLTMLKIDLKPIELISRTLNTTPYTYHVCSKGNATACTDKEPFTKYATTPEQMERLKYCNELIQTIETAGAKSTKNVNARTLGTFFTEFIYYDVESQKLVPNHNYVV